MIRRLLIPLAATAALTLAGGCTDSINEDNRIPAVAVNIRLDSQGLWDSYGVGGYGLYRYFVRDTREPANFSFNETTYTGYGGVLLIYGTDPFSGTTAGPMAYDMACPVEREPTVRVRIDPDNLEAVCPRCTSRFDVLMNAGAPVSGPANQPGSHYRLRMLRCLPGQYGGYVITQR